MALYRKKPVVIEAIQFNGENGQEVATFSGLVTEQVRLVNAPVFIETLEGRMRADVGDWIIKGIQGEFYPCKPDIFDATYELVVGA